MITYAICLIVGLVFTLLSVVAGHFFGGHGDHVSGSGGHAEAGSDNSDMPGISIFSPTVMASFVTAFGGFGLIFSQFPATRRLVLSAPLSLLCAALVGWVLYKFLRAVFSHTQSSSESRVAALPGTEATITRDRKGRLIVEAAKKPTMTELLDSWEPLSDEDAMPEIKDYPPEPFDL